MVCKKCIMDDSAKELVLDKRGICNFCEQAQKELKAIKELPAQLPELIKKIKKDGKGKEYDVLIGLSGGVDSSFTLHNLVKLGLRPLCFNIDNGWNLGKESDENVLKLVETLKVPFYRYNIDLNKFLELQGAFLKAGLINAEIPTDHIILAASYELASKYKIKWIISGGNIATESIMPESWSYNARDLKHIKDVYKRQTGLKLQGLPMCSLFKWNWYKWIKRIKTAYLLDYLNYNRQKAIEILQKEYNYIPYGDKHTESRFTKWFQNFYLFKKFGIDKRKAFYSSLINSGQMTRHEAREKLMNELQYPLLGIEEIVMEYPKGRHEDYANDQKAFNRISKLVKLLRQLKILKQEQAIV